MSVVNKCICHNRTFAEIKAHAEESGYQSIQQLQAEEYCSSSCGLCIPYVELMLETGETEFSPRAPYLRNRNRKED